MDITQVLNTLKDVLTILGVVVAAILGIVNRGKLVTIHDNTNSRLTDIDKKLEASEASNRELRERLITQAKPHISTELNP